MVYVFSPINMSTGQGTIHLHSLNTDNTDNASIDRSQIMSEASSLSFVSSALSPPTSTLKFPTLGSYIRPTVGTPHKGKQHTTRWSRHEQQRLTLCDCVALQGLVQSASQLLWPSLALSGKGGNKITILRNA